MIQQSHSWAYIQRKPYLENIHVARFTIGKSRTQHKCPLNMDMCTMEYYSATQKDETMPLAAK